MREKARFWIKISEKYRNISFRKKKMILSIYECACTYAMAAKARMI
jgi:hypothetical protein